MRLAALLMLDLGVGLLSVPESSVFPLCQIGFPAFCDQLPQGDTVKPPRVVLCEVSNLPLFSRVLSR